MLKYRLIFGILFSAMFVGLVFLDVYLSRGWQTGQGNVPPGAVIAVLCCALIPVAIREMRALLARQNVVISVRISAVAAILCMLWPWVEQVAEMSKPENMGAVANWFRTVKPQYLVPTVLTAALVAAFVFHSRHQKIEGAMSTAGGSLLAIVYLGVLPGFFLPICMTHSAWMMLAVIGIVKAADIGAYATGHAIGKHKLIPWLSPGKTKEGFVGGLVFSAAAGAGVAPLFAGFTWPQGLVAGALLGAVGQLGDLLESLLKRDAGVKDSGKVPGFGGVLDILDSPLLAAPVAYWLLKLVSKGA